jgi:hypothetical protein
MNKASLLSFQFVCLLLLVILHNLGIDTIGNDRHQISFYMNYGGYTSIIENYFSNKASLPLV